MAKAGKDEKEKKVEIDVSVKSRLKERAIQHIWQWSIVQGVGQKCKKTLCVRSRPDMLIGCCHIVQGKYDYVLDK